MIEFDYYKLHNLYYVFMMISMKRTYPYWGLIGFPTNDVAGLQEFARDFVIGFFEVQPRLWKQNKLSDDSKDFLTRMHRELTDLIDEKQVDEIMAWMRSWPFDRDLEIRANFIWEYILLPLHRRKHATSLLADNFQASTLATIDNVMDRYFASVQPLFRELNLMAMEHIDNWEYMIHYMYNRGEVRDGTKVELKSSPLTWLEHMIDTKKQCSSVREIKNVLTVEDFSTISKWLDQQPFWKDRKRIHHSLAELLNYLDLKCPS